jgi:heat shock protein HspQ
MKWIKLGESHINTDYILSVEKNYTFGHNSTIFYIDGVSANYEETPEEIMEMIRKRKDDGSEK